MKDSFAPFWIAKERWESNKIRSLLLRKIMRLTLPSNSYKSRIHMTSGGQIPSPVTSRSTKCMQINKQFKRNANLSNSTILAILSMKIAAFRAVEAAAVVLIKVLHLTASWIWPKLKFSIYNATKTWPLYLRTTFILKKMRVSLILMNPTYRSASVQNNRK